MTDRPETGDNGGAYQSGVLVWRNGVPDPGQVEALRVPLGDESAEQMLRASELMRNPRPLADEERALLDAVMDPMLADLRAVGAIVPKSATRRGRTGVLITCVPSSRRPVRTSAATACGWPGY